MIVEKSVLNDRDREKKGRVIVWFSVFFFRFWAPNPDQFFGLTQANFEANSADFHCLTQNFGHFKQKPCKNSLTGPTSWPNSANFMSNSAKIFL